VLRRIFGRERDEVKEDWRKQYKEEFYALYASPNTIRVFKSRRLRQVGHTGFWWRNVKEGDHLKDPGLDGRIILKWIFETWNSGGGGGHGSGSG
jgi:hypothetical protein